MVVKEEEKEQVAQVDTLQEASRCQIEESECLEESYWPHMAQAMADSVANVGDNALPMPPVPGMEATASTPSLGGGPNVHVGSV